MEKHNLFQKIDDLYPKVEFPLPKSMKKKMTALDDVMQQLMIDSKKKFQHLYMGEIRFSPEYAYYVQRRKG